MRPSLAVPCAAPRPGWLVVGLLLGLVLAGPSLWAGCCAFSAPPYRAPGGRSSDHFDGQRFRNPHPLPGVWDFLKWQLTRRQGRWRSFTAAPPGPPPPARVSGGRLRVTFVNHATVLLQMDGLNVLTDPIWSERTSPVSFVGPRRRRPPGLRFGDLPPIDLVLISHNHYDHLDLPTLRRLGARFRPRVLTGLGNSALLAEERVPVGRSSGDLDWWQSVEVRAPGGPGGTAAGPGASLRVTSVPVAHFSSRGICDREKTLWTGFVIEGPSGRVFFAGDTGYGEHFREIRRRLGRPRLAVLPIGAYRPEWFMSPVHISPREAVIAHRALQAGTSVGMHFGTFALADDGEDDAVRDLTQALADDGRDGSRRPRFWVLGFGEGREVPALAASDGTSGRRP